METNKNLTTFKLDNFEGPLDLLLYLINKNEVNIYDIPVSKITEQYLYILNNAQESDVDNMSEFYLLASTLLLIKSRMLLPVKAPDYEDEEPRRELIAQLVEYQKFKKLSGLMEERVREAKWIIDMKKRRFAASSQSELWQEVQPDELLKAFSVFASKLPVEHIIDMAEEVSVNEKIALLSELMEQKGECTFDELIKNKDSLLEFICAFLAILEAAKMNMINIYQHSIFGIISIHKAGALPPAP